VAKPQRKCSCGRRLLKYQHRCPPCRRRREASLNRAPCVACGEVRYVGRGQRRRQQKPLCTKCWHQPMTALCRCGNGFTPWLTNKGKPARARRTRCGRCPPRPRRVKQQVGHVCACCGKAFIGRQDMRYCGRACRIRFGSFLKSLRCRLGVRRSADISSETVSAAWAMAQVHCAIQGKPLFR
jgi:hypothetical protein